MARRPKGDAVDGVMLLDKPVGMSSNHALQRVRRMVNAAKAGHTGTLDPAASGLLPLCFGNATKFSADLLHAVKGYTARVKLGEATDTGDAEGEVVETSSTPVTEEALLEAARSFLGDILQVPPMYSALKRNGECLYDIARRGEVVERQPRPVTIHELTIRDFDGTSFTMDCLVSKGTYIRVLAEDIGRKLGSCAHLTALRRTRVGELTLDAAVTMEALETIARSCEAAGEAEDQAEAQKEACRAASLAALRAKLTPSDALLSTLERIDLATADAARFMNGQRILLAPPSGEGPTTENRVRVYDADGGLLGTAQLTDGLLAPERLIAH